VPNLGKARGHELAKAVMYRRAKNTLRMDGRMSQRVSGPALAHFPKNGHSPSLPSTGRILEILMRCGD
jgi:hypothetical protein